MPRFLVMTAEFARRYGSYALITGASAGIGEEFARQLARRGLNLVLVARRADRLASLADELKAAHGVDARVLSVDLQTEDAVDVVLRETEVVDIGLAVLNAGLHNVGLFVDIPARAHTDLVVLNVLRPMQLAHGLAPRFIARGRGGLVLVASLAAAAAMPYQANYAASKAYVSSLGQALRAELRDSNVDVTVLAPGIVNTDMAHRAPIDMKKNPLPVSDSPPVVTAALDGLGRKAVVVPGVVNTTMDIALRRLIPRVVSARAMLATAQRLYLPDR